MSKTATQTQPPVRSQVAIAACTAIIGSGTEIQLTPAGAFRGIDGRPGNVPHWYIDAEVAQGVIAAANARVNRFVIDFDHQTLRAEKNGQPAPASGWFERLEWREGVGLFGVGVEWTAAAQAMIDAREYRYISPVLSYDKVTGNVTGILMAALTNYPAIDGMDEATLAAACAHLNLSTAALSQELPQMDEIIEQLRWLLNLPLASTPEDILANLNKLADMIKSNTSGADNVAAASCDLNALLAGQFKKIAALSASPAEPDPAKFVDIGTFKELQQAHAALSANVTEPDPSKYVDIETFQALQRAHAALSATSAAASLDDVISKALAENRLLPSTEAWARRLGAKDIAALSAYLADAPVIPALSGRQSKTVELGAGFRLSENQVALCAALGLPQEEFAATLKAEQQV